MATIPAASKVGTSCKVSTKKKGKATITATAMDGSGKTAKVKLNVTPFESDKTPPPSAEPDTRKATKVEDFEGYDAGTAWTKYTASGKNCGHMTVVQDPENAENKCLQVKYDGTDDAYDFAPVFSVDLANLVDFEGKSTAGKTLSSYTGVRADIRVAGNSGDVKYKTIYCYFDQYDAIKTTDKFAAYDNKSNSAHVDSSGNPVPAGAANEDRAYRFGVNISMATGSEKKVPITLYNGNSSSEQEKYMPTFHESAWKMEETNTHFAQDSCTLGYKPTDGAEPAVGFGSRSLTIDTTRVNEADSTLLQQSKFDVVLGSTYQGAPIDSKTNTSVTVYFDNISLLEETIDLTGFDLSLSEGGDIVYPGGDTKANVTYTPENTTQKELIWTSSNPQVTIDTEGKISVAEDFDFGGQNEVEVVITATSKANPALTKSVTIKVCQIALPTEAYVFDFFSTFDAELSKGVTIEQTKDSEGVDCMKINFTGKNQRAYFKLPEAVNLSAYQKYELTGFVPQQMTLDFYDAKLPENIAKHDVDDTWQWWKMSSASQTPFYKGSSSNRLSDGTWVAPNDKETETELLSKIKNDESTAGNYNEVYYMALGNAIGDADLGYVPDGTYYIYSLKLTPKPTGELPKFTFATIPLTESFEDGNVLLGAENSVVKEATEASPAQEGTHYLEVSSSDQPSLLIDNREGTTKAKYQVCAYVKIKDESNIGTVTFLQGEHFMDKKYEQYEGYEDVETIDMKAVAQDLSNLDDPDENGWAMILANVTVSAGKIAEISIGSEDTSTFEYLLDNVTLTTR